MLLKDRLRIVPIIFSKMNVTLLKNESSLLIVVVVVVIISFAEEQGKLVPK
jgi:glutathionyl-hydroquinone reductase